MTIICPACGGDHNPMDCSTGVQPNKERAIEQTPFYAGEPFAQNVDGPDVALHTVFPVIERGPGTLRVRALAVSDDAQATITRALNAHDNLVKALEIALPYVQSIASRAPTEPARKMKQQQAAADVATIAAAISKAGAAS